MQKDLAQEAIALALRGKWKEAIAVNKQILKKDSKNVDALNRLARALKELGNINEAKIIAKKVLKIDSFNSIALKALEKWKTLKKGETYLSGPADPKIFLEEPGKTKIVGLLFLGSPKLLAKLDAGDEVKLNTHSHRVSVTTADGKYIGRLPDDLSARLKKLIELGNTYLVFIKSIDKSEVKVFIRESKRVEKLGDFPSFSPEKIDYISFTPPELIHKKEDLRIEQEEE